MQPKLKETVVESYVLVADKMHELLAEVLDKPVTLYSGILNDAKHQQIILDAQSNSFKTLIDFIEKSGENPSLTYKILPKRSQFIIGSNSSKGQGEVIKF